VADRATRICEKKPQLVAAAPKKIDCAPLAEIRDIRVYMPLLEEGFETDLIASPDFVATLKPTESTTARVESWAEIATILSGNFVGTWDLPVDGSVTAQGFAEKLVAAHMGAVEISDSQLRTSTDGAVVGWDALWPEVPAPCLTRVTLTLPAYDTVVPPKQDEKGKEPPPPPPSKGACAKAGVTDPTCKTNCDPIKDVDERADCILAYK
jgi:hypothetical protein